ncbi:bifunctional folylpolyglutamate synthase/dihydrofolate synthase [Bifidobacterium sp. ESL0763]|uniref:bifunctional folylpolyglutamate synthase/dihydrofolate synthase n=1 Tax=Bifidobacterium sp. ESL0763 TaxID=2983227 RepID=UPI0023F7096E|nr:folylpolyglutamate synthase/dihydrofolate synthase family protein [Bifidobacterium sp. ESL0763]MDF7664139.1 bifunctional folylpolyglutamate synthase/dihydrofolate synthase [Bifidobacterium sp. ESL0763]
MSFEHPHTNGITIREVEREIMRRRTTHEALDHDLEVMAMMLDLLGHPEDTFRVIHITGTNGKGSTARMAEAICRAYGMRTGLYTSPHLQKINERIAVDGQQLSDDDFIDTWMQIKDFVALVDARMEADGKAPMSYFEILTSMAVWKFADAPVDVAVFEVGMGGRWDATNALNGDAAIIGPVDMDHMQWLGDTPAKIAAEKAGIIKHESTAIIGAQPHEAEVMPVLEAAAVKAHATMVRDGEEMEVVSRQPAVGGQVVTLRTPNGTYRDIPVAKFGEHQAHNALAALAAAETVIPVAGRLTEEVVSEALGGVRIPGRIEQVRTSPTIIVDGGHNVNAAESLRAAIEENYHFEQLVGVVAMMKDKQVEEYLGTLEPILSQLIVTENSWRERVMPAEQLEKIAVGVFGRDRVTRIDELPDAIQRAVDLVDENDELGVGYGHGVLICGSFVTAGDARTLLAERKNPELALPKAQRVAGKAKDATDAAAAAKDDDEDIVSEVFGDAFGDFGVKQVPFANETEPGATAEQLRHHANSQAGKAAE